MDSMYEQIIAAGAYRHDTLVHIQLEDGCNFVYLPSDFDLLHVLERRTEYHRRPQYIKPKTIQTITGLNLTEERLYPHHSVIILRDTLEEEVYAVPLCTNLSIKMEKLYNDNRYRFSTEYASFLYDKDDGSPAIPVTRWLRFTRLENKTGITAVTELTIIDDKKTWNPIAIIDNRRAEILRMEIVAMGADQAFEGGEGGYHFVEYNVDIKTCQYIMNHSSFMAPKPYLPF